MSRTLPYVFTEQGLYMLMTVLRGELAVRQSKMLIRLFKQMKDCLVETNILPLWQSVTSLMAQTRENTRAISELNEDMALVKTALAQTRETLGTFMAGFGTAPFKNEYLVLNGKVVEASLAYREVLAYASKTVFVVDNYISIRTLLHLRDVPAGVRVLLFSDNLGKGLTASDFSDFQAEYPEVDIELRQSGGTFHDRFIVLDYGTASEKVLFCGASSKDAGRRTSFIYESDRPEMVHVVVEELLRQGKLVLR